MATKIEGWVQIDGLKDPRPLFIPGEKSESAHDFPASLVIHSGPPEKVFTETEVRAFVKDIIDAREAVRNSPEGMVWATPRQDIEHLAAFARSLERPEPSQKDRDELDRILFAVQKVLPYVADNAESGSKWRKSLEALITDVMKFRERMGFGEGPGWIMDGHITRTTWQRRLKAT